MKHLSILTATALMACAGVHAQNVSDNPIVKGEFTFSFIPSALTSDHKTKLTNTTEEQIKILDNFISDKSIPLEQIEKQSYYITREREAVVTDTVIQIRSYDYDSRFIEPDSVESYINSFKYSIRSGDTLIYLLNSEDDFYNSYEFGTKYPQHCYVFDFRTNTSIETRRLYQYDSSKSYTGEWSEEEPFVSKTMNYLARCQYTNFDSENPSNSGPAVVTTHLLFNNDNKYEYIRFKGVMESEISSDDRDNDGVIDYEREYFYPLVNGFEIVSEDGSVLQSVDFGYTMRYAGVPKTYLYKLNDNYYLSFYVETEDANGDRINLNIVYSISNKGATSVQQVGAPRRVSACPTVADRNTTIQVQTPATQNDRLMTVTDAAGKIVWKQTLPAGQTNTQIDTYNLSRGLNIIRVEGKNEGDNSCKIIVK